MDDTSNHRAGSRHIGLAAVADFDVAIKIGKAWLAISKTEPAGSRKVNAPVDQPHFKAGRRVASLTTARS